MTKTVFANVCLPLIQAIIFLILVVCFIFLPKKNRLIRTTTLQQLKAANRAYRKYKSNNCRNIVIEKRKIYCKAKRIAKIRYKNEQKRFFSDTAKNNPQKFWDEIRKIKGKNKCSPQVSTEDFFNHFKGLYSSENVYRDEEVENFLSNQDSIRTYVDQLDCPISIDEVKNSINSLKRKKSPGIDMLLPEIFIEGRDILSPLLCKIFNFMYDNSVYPECWAKSMLVPIPKKGDKRDVNNYRGISLSSIFSKIFSQVLDSRLRKWAEQNNLLMDYQFGFRQQKSTIDCIFILHSIINKVINYENRKLYCAFIDFQKAFDLVYRDGIWFKLLNSGVSCKLVKCLQAMYNSVKTCIKVNGSLTQYFDSYMGVKQGEPLSPLLFILFINDMSTSLYDDTVETISIDELQVFLLLFADDTVLFSYTPQGLQTLLNKLHAYCLKWNVNVNINKTVVLTFKKGCRIENVDIYYNNERLKNVGKFTYLGVTLSANGKVYQAQKTLSEQAMKALFSVNSLFDSVSLNVSEKIKLFDTMVLPILCYGCEVWGFHAALDVERVHLKFLKQILGVRIQTCNNAVYGEIGRVLLSIIRKVRILKFWFKIIKNPNSLLYKIFQDQINNSYLDSWASKVKQLFNELGFSFLWNNSNITNLQLTRIIERVYDQYYQNWYEALRASSKLSTYRTIKTKFAAEKYLNSVTDGRHRSELAKLRCSAHRLAVEDGRYRNIERQQRLCIHCQMSVIEDEYHFLLTCPFYREIRIKYIPKYYITWPNINKFKSLLTTEKPTLLKKIANFLYLAKQKREEALNA